ncbi:hypothetical protein NZD89_24890 [Alicyclobacillus fastidiosus]|uniref:Uncharacterized protein n=1 Tax=Alicyclobacillus fastidiosus TaxID=392011 RepID=A0ABY6ZF31_9BACL|nr:hypothetical protein [Alicyclobacillus fastidiosus]WAH41442.1 hypothetical protein NZD89_24890 [Alicyclobacillus fastidiosus]
MNLKDMTNASTIQYLKNTSEWEEFREALDGQDDETVARIFLQLLEAVKVMEGNYEKTTIEIRKDIMQKVRLYCARSPYNIKTFTNAALEAMVNILGDGREQ